MTRKPNRPPTMFRRAKKSRLGLWTLFISLLLLAGFIAVLQYSRPHVTGARLRFDSFVDLAGRGRILNARVLDQDAYVVGTYVPDAAGAPAPASASGAPFGAHGGLQVPVTGTNAPTVTGPAVPYSAPLLQNLQVPLVQLLVDNRIPTTIDQQVGKRVAGVAGFMLPGFLIVLLLGYLVLSYRRGSGLFGTRSGARKIVAEKGGVGFGDVAGQDAAVAELREIQQFLAEPERFAAVGATIPKGVLLFGPPGCGKTMLAKALAGEAGASFYSISGSDFVELYVGVGAARVRDLFKEARDNAPAIIFIDELDSIGRARGIVGVAQSHGEQEQALNQILAEMDGFTPGDGIIVIGATNRPDILDQALLRPGRFDRTVGLERPDEGARLAILSVHAKGKRLDAGVDLPAVAKRCIGLTGADLANVMNESALLAARAKKEEISPAEVDRAVQRILEAPERQRRLSLRQRSVGKRFSSEERVTFADVAGVDDALEELLEVKDYLAEPERFAKIGARIPRGILLSGPPGCGKTLLARAVAGEANAAFIAVAGSEFLEIFVGEGASRVRDLFADARSLAPAIVFIDEIDSIGATRGPSAEGHREREQTLNQILVELDGFEARSGVIVMAATNRPDILDPALVRPGRFDRHVTISPPGREGRRAILELHATGKQLAAGVRLDEVAGLTRGFSGADLANVLNEAALLAARQHLTEVPMSLVEEGIDRAYLGISSRGTLMSDEERRVVAYHEAGHALVGRALPGATPPHKLSILPRGGTLGRCTILDTHDRVIVSRSMLMDRMAALLGGWSAETLVFGEAGSGSSGDLERVGAIARQMVRDYGMSEELGPLAYPDGGSGRSERESQIIYSEVRRLVDESRQRAHEVLTGSRAALERLADALLEHETLSSDEIDLVAGATVVNRARRSDGVATVGVGPARESRSGTRGRAVP